MTHLPECPDQHSSHDGTCICDRLRACEARVREESGFGCCDALWNKGYAAALEAARDAVAALIVQPRWGTVNHGLVIKDDALAAIDALREGK